MGIDLGKRASLRVPKEKSSGKLQFRLLIGVAKAYEIGEGMFLLYVFSIVGAI